MAGFQWHSSSVLGCGWLRNTAIGGCWIAAAVFFASASYGQPSALQPQNSIASPAQAQNYSKPPLPITVIGPIGLEREKTAQTDWAKPNCEKPNSHDEADLCQQITMAAATQQAVTLNYIQMGIGIVTLFGLGLTVYYTRETASAAIRSADAVPNVERAYVFLWNIERRDMKFSTGQTRMVVIPTDGQNVIYKNCGKTPAVVTKTRLGCGVFPAPPVPQTAPERERPSGAVVGAGEEWVRGRVVVTKDMKAQAAAESADIYLYGEITYRDIFGNERRSWFVRKWAGDHFVFGDLEDEALNGST